LADFLSKTGKEKLGISFTSDPKLSD